VITGKQFWKKDMNRWKDEIQRTFLMDVNMLKIVFYLLEVLEDEVNFEVILGMVSSNKSSSSSSSSTPPRNTMLMNMDMDAISASLAIGLLNIGFSVKRDEIYDPSTREIKYQFSSVWRHSEVPIRLMLKSILDFLINSNSTSAEEKSLYQAQVLTEPDKNQRTKARQSIRMEPVVVVNTNTPTIQNPYHSSTSSSSTSKTYTPPGGPQTIRSSVQLSTPIAISAPSYQPPPPSPPTSSSNSFLNGSGGRPPSQNRIVLANSRVSIRGTEPDGAERKPILPEKNPRVSSRMRDSISIKNNQIPLSSPSTPSTSSSSSSYNPPSTSSPSPSSSTPPQTKSDKELLQELEAELEKLMF